MVSRNTPAGIVWQSPRHLVAEITVGAPVNETLNKTDVVDGTPRYQPWAGGMVCFFLASSYFCRAAVELRYRSRSDGLPVQPPSRTSQ